MDCVLCFLVMLHRVHCVSAGTWCNILKNITSSTNRIICVRDFAFVTRSLISKHITFFSPHISLRCKSSNVNENSSLSEVKDSSNSQLTLGQKGIFVFLVLYLSINI